MRRILAVALLLLFLSGSLLASSGPIQAPPSASDVEKKADLKPASAPAGLVGVFQSWLMDLLGLGPDDVDNDEDKDPVLDDGTGTGHRAVAVRADYGQYEID